ncbi:ABC transporter ATP-binding protein [Paenibacillus tarimensis]
MARVLRYLKKLHHYAGIKLYINVAGMMVISMLEGVSVLLLIPMLSFVGLFNESTVNIPYLSELFAPLQSVPESLKLPVVLAIFVVMITGQAIVQRIHANQSAAIQQGYMRQLRQDIYENLMKANWSFFLKQRKSDFNHILTNELARVGQGIYMTLRMVTILLFTFIQIGLAFMLSVELTASIIFCGLILAIYARKFLRKANTLGMQTTELSQSYIAGISEHFSGIKDIKSNRLEEKHAAWFRSLIRRMENNYVQFARLQSASQFYYRMASAVLAAVFIYLAFGVFHVPAEQLLLIVVIFSRLWPRFQMIQSSWEQIVSTFPAFKSLNDLQQDYEQHREVQLLGDDYESGSIKLERGIVMKSLYFRYAGQSDYALEDINLTVPANGMTAVVGQSGAGKSTLIDILIGLIEPVHGEILVDGKPLMGKDAAEFRHSIGYVSQDPFLFHSSIRENLLLAAPDASEEQLWLALDFAAASEFVQRLPDGLETVLGDRGVRLSGGERQRIVLARAILRKPAILILDEATSALDSENEAKVQEAIDRLKGSMTIIVIAHRLSTIRNADQVIVMEKGKIIQQGAYRQLSEEKRGTFHQLLEYQAK